MRRLLEKFHLIFPGIPRPSLVVSGHIHESTRTGVFACAEAYQGAVNDSSPHDDASSRVSPRPAQFLWPELSRPEITTFCSIGNEGLTVPHCLKCSFLVVDVGDDGAILRVERVVRDVELYADAVESFSLFKNSVHVLQDAIERADSAPGGFGLL